MIFDRIQMMSVIRNHGVRGRQGWIVGNDPMSLSAELPSVTTFERMFICSSSPVSGGSAIIDDLFGGNLDEMNILADLINDMMTADHWLRALYKHNTDEAIAALDELALVDPQLALMMKMNMILDNLTH